MDLRKSERFKASKEILVAIDFSQEKSRGTVIGSLIDISQSGLAFKYLPLDTDEETLGSGFYKVMVRCNPGSFCGLPLSRIVYDEPLYFEQSYLLPPSRRCGVQFASPLSPEELLSIVSGSCS